MQVRILANRIAPHRAPITVSLSQVAGLDLPESVVVPEGESSVTLQVAASDDVKPGSYSVGLSGQGRSGKFEETWGAKSLEVVVPAPEKAGD